MTESVHDVLMGIEAKLEFVFTAIDAFAEYPNEISGRAFIGAADVLKDAFERLKNITDHEELTGKIQMPQTAGDKEMQAEITERGQIGKPTDFELPTDEVANG